MIPLQFSGNEAREMNILCIGAHSDDIEIGCGGTIIKLVEQSLNYNFLWVVLSASGNRVEEARKSAEIYLNDIKNKEIVIADFQDSYFPYNGKEIKEFFTSIRAKMDPDVIFTTYRNDLHQDHRLVSELTLNTFRDHLIYEYEILKYDGDLGTPNTYVPLEKRVCSEKIKRLNLCFNTQSVKQWFDDESFMALMRIRGVEINSKTNYAEAFYCRKSCISFPSE